MAERTSNFTTEAYLAASQAWLNLIFDKFWAQLAARQMVTPQPVQHTAEPEKSQTYLHSPAKRPKPPSTQINLWRSRKKLQKLKIHTPVSPWRLAKPGGKHMAVNSTDKGQANGTLTPTTHKMADLCAGAPRGTQAQYSLTPSRKVQTRKTPTHCRANHDLPTDWASDERVRSRGRSFGMSQQGR
ncbi:Hypothetical predicted protein [Pelobates cultripes]|uniref:Uncharacterized protein n=1 Tax=Pelobates cultripes TaxID=61616 RepID=A0AAD1VRB2_PELCU|nr:Hypothetical predicted protein [Pelobates cultripes]